MEDPFASIDPQKEQDPFAAIDPQNQYTAVIASPAEDPFASIDQPAPRPDFLETAVKTVLRAGTPVLPPAIEKYNPFSIPERLLTSSAESHPATLDQPNPERALPAQLPALAEGVQQIGANLPYVSPVTKPIAKAASWAIKSSPVSTLAKGVDWLQHGQFATALMTHKAIQAYRTNSPDGIMAILKAGKDEYLDPKQRLSYTDLIHNYAPDFAKAHPIAAEVAGFALDVLADPLTYLTGTLSDYVKVAGKAGPKLTEIVPSITRGLPELRSEIKAATEAARASTAAGEVLTTVPRDLAEAAWRKRFAELPVDEAAKWVEKEAFRVGKTAVSPRLFGKPIPFLNRTPNILRLQQDALEFNRAAEAATALNKVEAARKALSTADALEVQTALKGYTDQRDAALKAVTQQVEGAAKPNLDISYQPRPHMPYAEIVPPVQINPMSDPMFIRKDNIPIIRMQSTEGKEFSKDRGGWYASMVGSFEGTSTHYAGAFGNLGGKVKYAASFTPENPLFLVNDTPQITRSAIDRLTGVNEFMKTINTDADRAAALVKYLGMSEKEASALVAKGKGFWADRLTNDLARKNGFDSIIAVTPSGDYGEVSILKPNIIPKRIPEMQPTARSVAAVTAPLEAKIAEHQALLDQITALDAQAEELRKTIAGPFRQPAPLIKPADVPLSAPFEYIAKKFPQYADTLNAMRPGQYLKRAAATAEYFGALTFKKHAYMGDVLGDMMDKFQVRLGDARATAEDFVTKFSTGLNKAERQQIGTKMHEIQTAVETAADEWKAAGKGELPDGEVWKIRQKVLDQTPQGKGLGQMTANSRARFMEWVDEFQKRGEDYKRLGLIQHLQKAYARHEYQNIDPEAMVRYIRYKRAGLPGMFGPGEERFFRTIEEAKAAGFKPELDVAVMLANYIRDGERAIVQKELDKGIFRAYGVQSWGELEKTLGASSKEWKSLNQEVRYLGNPNFSMFANHDWVQMALRGMDRVTNPFRMGATYGNPAWGMKQAPSNFMQFLLRNSMKVHRGFSPTTHLATMMTLLHDRGILQTLPETPWSRMFSMLGLKKPAGINTAMRDSLTLDDLVTSLKTNGLISGQHLGSPTKIGKRLDWAIAKANMTEKAAGRLPEALQKPMKGIAAFLGQAADYRNWPSFLEDYGKTYSFINAKLLGQSDKEATRLAFSALYNYDRGLSMVERQVIKRLIPFYSYPRFTAALATSALFERPATIGNLKKGIDHFLSAYGHLKALDRGEDQTPLTEDERMSIKPYRLENPTAFTGREIKDDQVLSVLHSFNNFNPLDTWMTDEPGAYTPDSGPARAIQKIVFASVVPWLKAAIEIPMNHEFFTGNTIVPETERLRPNEPPLKKIGKNIDPNVLLSDMVAALGGGTGGTLGAIGGKLFGNQAAALGGAEILKRILGWEEITQPDGTKQVYVSPYKIYAITSMYPMLRRVIRWDDTTKTAAERNYEFWTGVLIQKANLKKEYESQGAMLARERDKRAAEYAKELELSKIRQAQQYGFEPLIDAKNKYDEILQYIKDYEQIQPSNIQ